MVMLGNLPLRSRWPVYEVPQATRDLQEFLRDLCPVPWTTVVLGGGDKYKDGQRYEVATLKAVRDDVKIIVEWSRVAHADWDVSDIQVWLRDEYHDQGDFYQPDPKHAHASQWATVTWDDLCVLIEMDEDELLALLRRVFGPYRAVA